MHRATAALVICVLWAARAHAITPILNAPGAAVNYGGWGASWLGSTSAIAVADVNEDGFLDYVVPEADHGLQVILARAQGELEFLAPLAGPYPGALATGDFDGDQHLDLVVAPLAYGTSKLDTLLVFHGNGDGTFGSPATVHVGALNTVSLAVCDFNADGALDIAAGTASGSVIELDGDGHGGFGPGRSIYASPPWGGGGTSSMATGDFDHDGRLDAVVAASPQAVTVLLSKYGHASATQLPSALGTNAVAVADLNHDGWADVVASTVPTSWPVDTTFVVFLNDGAGHLKFFRGERGEAMSGSPLLADFTGDGEIDIALCRPLVFQFTSETASVFVYPGLGNGYTLDGYETPVGDKTPAAWALASLDGDARADIWMLFGADFYGQRTACVLPLQARGDGGFVSPDVLGVPATPTALAVADFTTDGIADVAVASYDPIQGSSLEVLDGSTWGIGEPITLRLSARVQELLAGDWAGRGRADLACRFDKSVAIYPSDGIGFFGAPVTIQAGVTTYGMALGDLDHAGRSDVVLTTDTSLLVWRVQSNGSVLGPASYPLGTSPRGVALSDVNQDGNLDAIVAGWQWLRIFLGAGDGTFLAQPEIPVSAAYARLRALDFCGSSNPGAGEPDGIPDLFASGQGLLTLYPGLAGGGFAPQFDITRDCTQSGGFALGDVTADGRPDFVSVDYLRHWQVTLTPWGTNGGLAPPLRYGMGGRALDVGLFDADVDGRLDVVVLDDFRSVLTVLRNVRDASVSAHGAGDGAAEAVAPALRLRRVQSLVARGGAVRMDVQASRAIDANLQILDVRGRVLATPFAGRLHAGTQTIVWNRTPEAVSGVYWCVLSGAAQRAVRKLVFLR